MSSRLIYVLIGLMIVSLIGIIVLQQRWIQNAYNEKAREFSSSVNNALNDFNDDIDEDEAVIFLRQEFGNVDSLINEFVIEELDHAPIDWENERVDQHSEIRISYNSESHVHHQVVGEEDQVIVLPNDSEKSHVEMIELAMDGLDSTLSATIHGKGSPDPHMEHVTSLIQRVSFEKTSSNNLPDRLPQDEIKKRLAATLQEEGIDQEPAFAVFDTLKRQYVSSHVSSGYDTTAHEDYSKGLFPNDRTRSNNLDLKLQFPDESGYVWSEIRPMLWLSILFTALILLCFGYSLYFIFKQKRISQVKNDFINNMTHELKTPLASISLAASSIEHPKVIQDPNEISHFVDIIKSEERRINSHVERVLEIAQLDKAELKLNKTSVDLLDIIQAGAKNVDLSLSAQNGVVTFDCPMIDAPIQADEYHLTNVVTNVLDNSIKYRRDSLKISIRVREVNTGYQLVFEDNGMGMSKKAQVLAFDKFFRAETGNIHQRKGFGLGLSYVKSIVEAHGGSVRIQSSIDVGTKLTIEIPKS